MIERPNDHDDEYRVRRNEVRLLSIPEHRFVMVEGSRPDGIDAAFEGFWSPVAAALYPRRGKR